MVDKADLQNLLKEKEKGCGKWYPDECITFPRKEPTLVGSTCGKRDMMNYLHLCPICKAEISILKQALEVIDNEKKEILEKIDNLKYNLILWSELIRKDNSIFRWGEDRLNDEWTSKINNKLEELKQQLSQPKEEKE